MAGKTGRRIYKTKRWAVTRLAVFERDGFRCVKCGRRSALECDHIRPVVRGGDWFSMSNLRTLCRTCHLAVSAADRREPLRGLRAELRRMAIGG